MRSRHSPLAAVAALTLAATLLLAPQANAKPLEPGAYRAIGEVCGLAIARLRNFAAAIWPEHGRDLPPELQQRAVDNANETVKRAYETIEFLIERPVEGTVPRLGGDEAQGHARLAVQAIQTLATGQPAPPPPTRSTNTDRIEGALLDLYTACRKTMKRNKVILPASYPYSLD